MNDPDRAYDEHRQECCDNGICHFCEGEGCPRCKDPTNFEVNQSGTFKTLCEKDARIEELENHIRAVAKGMSEQLPRTAKLLMEVLDEV